MLDLAKTLVRAALHTRAARHWTGVSTAAAPARLRWWDSETVVGHVSRAICGVAHAELGMSAVTLLRTRYPGRVFRRAVSIGCGHGAREMALLREGVVDRFDLFELSPARVAAGRAEAARRGLGDRAVFHNRDGLAEDAPGRYDLVHWCGALHHMLDVEAALAWSERVLAPGGVFFFDDFVGPDRMQWSARMLRMASRARRALPARCLADPRRPGRSLPRRVKRPNRFLVMLSDPTECADSGRILAATRRRFPGVEIRPTGGAIYHLALNDVIHNLDEADPDDRRVLRQLLRIDDLCARLGEYHYAVAVAEKAT